VLDLEANGEHLADRIQRISGVRRITPVSADRFKIDATADVRSSIAKTVVESGAELRALSIARASLEDVYTRHFQEVRHAA